MANPTVVADIEARWRPLTPAEEVNTVALLADAWALLIARRPTLDADVVAGTVSTGNVVRVVSAMVLRVLRNPEGYRSETVDDYGYTRDELVASGALHVTADELADVTPNGARQVRSVRLVVHGDV